LNYNNGSQLQNSMSRFYLRTGQVQTMDIKTLEAAMHEFVESKGWYKPDSPHPQTPKNLAISLVMEASEVLEHFQWSETTADKAELAGELADVMLYLLQIASLQGIDLGEAVMAKLKVNEERDWKE
jgi:NTP pyrophosphatase (non-canonical NTP hydrolase)